MLAYQNSEMADFFFFKNIIYEVSSQYLYFLLHDSLD